MAIKLPSSMMIADTTLERAKAAAAAFDLVSVREASALLGISIRALRYWQRDGRMPDRFKHGRNRKYRRPEIEALRDLTRGSRR